MKKLLFNLRVSKVVFITLVLLNLFLPLYPERIVNVSPFQVAVIIFWLYGLLCQLGYFKKQVSCEENGKIRYEWHIPIAPIGVTRIAQALYYYFSKTGVNIWAFVVLVVLDVVYIIFMAIDGYSYYYESEVD